MDIEISSLLPMLLMMQILPALTGNGGEVASGNTVLLPVAIGQVTLSMPGPAGITLPIGVEADRRTQRRDRRNIPGTGRRAEDQYQAPYAYNGTFGYNGT